MPAGDGGALRGAGQAWQPACDNSLHSGVMSHVEQPSTDNTNLDPKHANMHLLLTESCSRDHVST